MLHTKSILLIYGFAENDLNDFFEVERGDLCFKEDDGKSNSSRIDCAQKLPLVCLKNNGRFKNDTEICDRPKYKQINALHIF